MAVNAHLTLVGTTVVVDCARAPELTEGIHRAFFETALGMDLVGATYRSTPGSNIASVITEATEYLSDEEVDVSCDAAAQGLLDRARAATKEFEEARTIGAKFRGKAVTTPKLDLPDFKRTLKDYQTRAVSQLLSVRNGANFSVPGSGKTTMLYATYARLRATGVVDTLLVVGPRSCFMPWEEEFEGCFGRRPVTVRLTGPYETRERLYREAANADLVLVTYQTASNDVDDLIAFLRKHKVFLVLDEAHHAKSFHGRTWASSMLALAPHAERRAVLTGTPMPNSPLDLWTPMTFLWPSNEVLGTREQFKYRCGLEGGFEEIREAVRPFFVRVRKRDLDLPQPKFIVHEVTMAPLQARIYTALATRVLSELKTEPHERQRLREWRKARMVRLLQSASNPTLLGQYSEEFQVPPVDSSGASLLDLIDRYPDYEKPAKVVAAANLARQQLARGRRVIVWTVFVHNIRMLASELRDLDPLVLYGAVPRDEKEDEEWNREKILRDFRDGSEARVLLANPMACGESVSLHERCHDAIYLDRTFNCGQFMQSLDRIHRIGIDPNADVTYRLLIAKDSIDEVVNSRLQEKQAQMLHLLDDDLPVMTYELQSDVVSDIEEERDFSATVDHLRTVTPTKRTRRKN